MKKPEPKKWAVWSKPYHGVQHLASGSSIMTFWATIDVRGSFTLLRTYRVNAANTGLDSDEQVFWNAIDARKAAEKYMSNLGYTIVPLTV